MAQQPSLPVTTLQLSSRSPRRKRIFLLQGATWFLLPALVLYLIFVIYPIMSGFYYGLTNWNALSPDPTFVGFQNFSAILQDGEFWNAVRVTALYAVTAVVVQNFLALLLALCFEKVRGLPGVGAIRAFLLIPGLFSGLAISYVWSYMLAPNDGVLNLFLHNIGLSFLAHDWLGDPHTALGSIIFTALWQATSFTMVVYLAGLQSVPAELQEAASIDGATGWQRLIHVTLPLIAPAFTINLVLGIINSLKVFDIVFIMTGGGPGIATETLLVHIYREAFSVFNFGYATAMGVVAFLGILIVSIVALRLLQQREVAL